MSGNVWQNLLLEENLDEEDNTGTMLAGTIQKGMQTVLSTVSRASPGFNPTKLLQPPSNRATLGTLRHRSTSHSGTPSAHPETSHENNKKASVKENKEPAEDKTISSATSSDDRFEQVC